MDAREAPLCRCGCGKQTQRTFSQFITGHNSRMGRRKEWPISTCRHCCKSFEVDPYMKGRRVFCSQRCRDDFRRASVGPLSPSYKRTEVPCAICGTRFFATDARIKRNVCCSTACGYESRRRKIAGAARKSTRVSAKRRSEIVRERDGNRCRVCGFEYVLHIHHIRGRKAGDAYENLITLCPNHHMMAHSRMLTVAELVSALGSPLRFPPLPPNGQTMNLRIPPD